MPEKPTKIRCPDCESQDMRLPENVTKRDGGFYIKGTDIQLHTLPNPAYICGNCGRSISSTEVFSLLS